MLQNLKVSLQIDLGETEVNLNDFGEANQSINILLNHMRQDLPFNDSLNFHFTNSTALWYPKLDQEVFASLTSSDLNIISNDSLKKEIISYYSFAKCKFDVTINRSTNILEDVSKNVFNIRFNTLWNNTWDDPDNHLEKKWMIPHDYAALKKEREYYYFWSSQKKISCIGM